MARFYRVLKADHALIGTNLLSPLGYYLQSTARIRGFGLAGFRSWQRCTDPKMVLGKAVASKKGYNTLDPVINWGTK
jgi:hypothetical protein